MSQTERMLKILKEYNEKLTEELKKFPFQEEEPKILINGYINCFEPIEIITYKSGNWGIQLGSANINMGGINSIQYYEGHGV